MPIPSVIGDLSTTASSNGPAGSETPTDGDGYLRAHAGFIAELRDKTNGTATGTTLNTPTLNGLVTFGEGWTLDTSGRLRNTSNEQPAFHAAKSGSTDQTSGAAVIFNTELFDQGGVYDNATGVFTAPVAGVYMVCAHVRIGASSSASDTLRIVGSTAGTIAMIPLDQGTGVVKECPMTAIIRLAAAETVSVGLLGGGAFSSADFRVENSYSAGNNRFSAAMLY